LFSFGVVLYEMNGIEPFRGETAGLVASKPGSRRAPIRLNPGTRREEIIIKALEKKKAALPIGR
jgi:hypothetical protein